MRSDDIPLHDIKPLVEIHDYTPYYLAAAAAVVLFFLLLVLYLVIRRYREERRENARRASLKALEAVNLDDAKDAAYAITRLGRRFAADSPQLQEAFMNLEQRLEPYKFRKRVPPIDEETRAYFRIYLGMIDV
ncbi:hypothetical protein [Sulfurimonas diazotrophicus]|uniref:DUF4381 domain-containing protein n=1 Tax=Sulfurimonas diazotrophicus TaxID=3131939 RepID=A0ABZ3HA06_9BACT